MSKYIVFLGVVLMNIMLYNLKGLYGYSFGNLDFDPNCFCLKFEKKSPFRV